MLDDHKDFNPLLVSQASRQTRKKRVKWAVIALAIAAFIVLALLLK